MAISKKDTEDLFEKINRQRRLKRLKAVRPTLDKLEARIDKKLRAFELGSKVPVNVSLDEIALQGLIEKYRAKGWKVVFHLSDNYGCEPQDARGEHDSNWLEFS